MEHCEIRKAFDSLWSITDEIFKYVTDIRGIINVAKGSEGETESSDPPSYENSLPEELIEDLNQKVSCLENLNEKRKALIGEFSIVSKSDDLDEKKQIGEKSSEHAPVSPRDNALKSLLSYTRTRQAVVKKSLDLLQQASQDMSKFCDKLLYQRQAEKEPDRGCERWEADNLYGAMNKYALSNSQLSEGRVALLKEGKIFEETILKVPHETNEETTKILKNVEGSYLGVKNANLSWFAENMQPILEDYLTIQNRFLIRDTVKSVAISMQTSFNDYTRKVHAYNDALQSLADHVII